MTEQLRIVRDFGTKVGYTGLWLVQSRFSDAGEFKTIYIADSQKEAKDYIDNAPDWTKC